MPPASAHNSGVELQVSTPAGYWGQPDVCESQLGCPGEYYYMDSLANWSGGGPFGPIAESISGGVSTGDSQPCGASATVSLSGSVNGDWTTSGGVYDSTNADVPSAFLMSGSFGLPSFSLAVTVSGQVQAACDVPIPGLSLPGEGVDAGLYLHLEGDLTGSLTFTETLKNLSINVGDLGWVDGQLIDDASVLCDGEPIGLSDLSDLSNCVSNQIQTTFSGSLKIGPELEIGSTAPDLTAKAGVGPLLGMGLDSDGKADVCAAPIDANYDLKITSAVHETGEAILPGPLQLLGDPSACPFGTAQATSDDGSLSATATGGNGTLSVAQDASDPVTSQGPNNTGGYFSVQAVSDPFTSVTVTDCNLGGGNTVFWWSGTDWVVVADGSVTNGTPPCISFNVTDSTTPALSDLAANALFSVGTNALAVSTTSVPGATAGTGYPNTVLAASGGTVPYSWAVTTGSLPPGLSLDASSGTLSGTPTTGGTYPFTVGVTDSEATPVTATANLSITVAPATTSTSIGTSASSVSTGTPVTYTATVTSPVTPTGTVDFSDAASPISTCQNVTLSTSSPYTATCTLTYSSAGSHQVSAAYSGDTSNSSSSSPAVDVTVTGNSTPLAVSTTSVPGATAGTGYPNTVLAASGGTVPYSWAVTTGSLPPGLSLDASSGTLSGTPTTGGTYPFTVGVTDSEATPVTATANLSITVAPATTSPLDRRLGLLGRHRYSGHLHGHGHLAGRPDGDRRLLRRRLTHQHLSERGALGLVALHGHLHAHLLLGWITPGERRLLG